MTKSDREYIKTIVFLSTGLILTAIGVIGGAIKGHDTPLIVGAVLGLGIGMIFASSFSLLVRKQSSITDDQVDAETNA